MTKLERQKQDCFIIKNLLEVWLDQMEISAEVKVTPKTDDGMKEAG